jgi:hypothetical protein
LKKSVVFISALVFAASTAAVAAVHTVGGGAPNIGNTYPFYGSSPAFRWQTMWFQRELNEAGPVTKIEWQTWTTAGVGGKYQDCDILLCHTGFSALTATFALNYGGKTPVRVYNGIYVLPASNPLAWVTIVEPSNFTYNNTDNLLIEISWQTGTGVPNYFWTRTSGSNFPGRVYNTSSKTATTGTLNGSYHHYGRITIGYVGVSPTSLGRVRALFR